MSETFQEMTEREWLELPYVVTHPDGTGTVPRFKTWQQALAAQKRWNIDCPGHVAKRESPKKRESIP